MPKLPTVKLLKQVKTDSRWVLATALFDSKGRVRRDHVRVNGSDETHPEGSYFIEWWNEGQRAPRSGGSRCPGCSRQSPRPAGRTCWPLRNGVIPPLTAH